MNDVFIVLGLCAMPAALLPFVFRWARKRGEPGREFAQSLSQRGYSLHREPDYRFDQQFPNFPQLHKGEDRYAFNIVRGARGRWQFVAFEYHFNYVASPRHRTRVPNWLSAVVLVPDFPLKPLHIGFENAWDKIERIAGIHDIQFDDPEFDCLFRVESPDVEWARTILNPAARQFLIANLRGNLTMEVEGVWMELGNWATTLEPALDVMSGWMDVVSNPALKRECSGKKGRD